jgi:photosystem II stability/assembly factor-like uncharacterized protein
MAYISRLTFSDPLHGWALGYGSGHDGRLLSKTTDGGITWSTIRVQADVEAAMDRSPSGSSGWWSLRFVDEQHGWLFGSIVDPGYVYRTTDGGQTWSRELRLDSVVALEPNSGTVWALQRRCDTGTIPNCALHPTLSSDKGLTWVESAAQLPQYTDGPVKFMRVTEHDAYVAVPRIERFNTNNNETWSYALYSTSDGGATWQTGEAPRSDFAAMVALPGGHLWLVVGGQPGAGHQGKGVLTSSDSGRTWNMVVSASRSGTFSYSGYSYGEIAAISPTDAWVLLVRPGQLLHTTDGGHTWERVRLPLGDVNNGNLMFTDDQHGWFTVYDRVFRTTDGGKTWHSSEVP